MEKKEYTCDVGGKTLTATFSNLTGQADGSVLLRMGETVVLVTAVMGKEESGASYFPLSVEFEERFYAAGHILGSRFMRREGRPSEEAVLSARIVDRTIRPLFDHHIRTDVQVVVTVIALGEEDPDVLGVIGASLALSVSDIPWNGPVGAVRIGKEKDSGKLIVNPNYSEREGGKLSLEVFACGTEGAINMIEVGGSEVGEEEIVAALEEARGVHHVLEKFQKKLVSEIGKEKRVIVHAEIPEEMKVLFDKHITPKLTEAVFSGTPGKGAIYALKDAWYELLGENLETYDKHRAGALFEDAVDTEIHRGAVEDEKRADGRNFDEIRPLFAQAGGVSSMLHGSGIFYRGDTHILSVLTLGGPEDSLIVDTMEEQEGRKRFMHHYNFPPFSVGETGRIGGFNRRMIGHGALAEKALEPVVPPKETFPYTIRLVSETMSSNGSSSMGSVCGSTLALMDGGVPLARPVAGIASGLMMKDENEYALLTDIQGPEDEHGDMDFKVAGTREGITAIQMDVKVSGIPITILKEALEAARTARHKILDVIEAEISTPRADISPRAPKITVLTISASKIGSVIGSGGKTINKIKEDTGVSEISIEEDGTIYITGLGDSGERAKKTIEALVHEYEEGEVVTGTVTRLAPFGAFVTLNAHTDALIHISEIAPKRIENVEDVLKIGETVTAVVKKVDGEKIGLSIKDHNPEFLNQKNG